MDKTEKLRLKKFLDDNFDFGSLKKVGFWPPGTRKTDHEVIAARICQRLGLKSIYDYHPPEMVVLGGIVVGGWPARVDVDGYKPGGGFWLSVT